MTEDEWKALKPGDKIRGSSGAGGAIHTVSHSYDGEKVTLVGGYPVYYWELWDKMPDKMPSQDSVNNPSHYNQGGLEVIDAITAWGLGFELGNCIKYIARAGKKDPSKTVEDLKKARWYLDHYIRRLEADRPPFPERAAE